jgi:hypothetical protein
MWASGLIFVGMRNKFLKLHRTIICVLDRKKPLPMMLQRTVVCQERFYDLGVIWQESSPDVMQMTVQIEGAIGWNKFRWFMGQPHSAIDHRIAGKIETVFHPPRTASFIVVIPTHQDFSAGQQGMDGVPAFGLMHEHVTQVNNQIFWPHRVLPVTNQEISEILGTVTVRGYFEVIEMRVGDEISFHAGRPVSSRGTIGPNETAIAPCFFISRYA